MNNIKVLDCTLRDGGYVNNWKFGKENITKIIDSLVLANIDIVECGFATNKTTWNCDETKFTNFAFFDEILSKDKANTMYVCMINYGEFDIDCIPQKKETIIDGIRVAFHKEDMVEALLFANKIKEKGFLVFIQPMVTLRYSSEEFVDLINKVNDISPYSFYIVDSFGSMSIEQLTSSYNLVKSFLNPSIIVGFHSHNNLQLAYANAQKIIELAKNKEVIIDASIMGMGRGAGNLNVELITNYINNICHQQYKIKPILKVVDEVINNVYLKYYWGYSLPNYISAINLCHPNYASFLMEKNNLSIDYINEIIREIDDIKKNNFDKQYIENLYSSFMKKNNYSSESIDELSKLLYKKKVLLIAPGKTLNEYETKITQFLADNPKALIIAVNFEYPQLNDSYIFLANNRRAENLVNANSSKIIKTSNVTEFEDAKFTVSYTDLLNETEGVRDNSGLMAIKLLLRFKAKKIFLAGFDGYSESGDTYITESLAYNTKNTNMLNEGICKEFSKANESVPLQFLTKEINLRVKEY